MSTQSKINKFIQKSMLGFWYCLYLPIFFFRRVLILPRKEKILLKRIKNFENKNNSEDKGVQNIFLFSTTRTDKSERQEILETTLKLGLSPLQAEKNLQYKVVDASSNNFTKINKNIFLKHSGLMKLDYAAEEISFIQAYAETLSQNKNKFFCNVFDDQPIIGLTYEFLKASEKLLLDFEGLVNIVLIEQITDYNLNKENKEIQVSLKDLEFAQTKQSPLGIVKYNGYSFAIMRNYHYGFFFNTIIASCDDYYNKLSWYRTHISKLSPHFIERAGMHNIGPIYNFIAVPLEVFRMDIDYVHSDISIRGVGETVKDLFMALKDNYKLIINK